MTILVLGDANADLSARMARFPAEGDDAPIGALGWGSGGAGVNVAAALALLGAPARLLACVGADPGADVALRAARERGADLAAVQVDPAVATGLCFAAVSPGGERTFFSFRGANPRLALPDVPAALAGVRWLHVCGHALLEGGQREAALALLAAAERLGVPASLDLCLPLIHTRRGEIAGLLHCLHTLFVNEMELAALGPSFAEAEGAESAASAEMGEGFDHGEGAAPSRSPLPVAPAALPVAPRARLVVKLGAHGCRLGSGEVGEAIPAFAVDALDTTGCGDAFAAGYIRAHLAGADPAACAALGNALGALVATRTGAADALPARAELRAFVAKHAPVLVGLLEPDENHGT
jgi:ribokinase